MKPSLGCTLRKKAVMPASVPPEPTPTAMASTSWPICAQISGAVPDMLTPEVLAEINKELAS